MLDAIASSADLEAAAARASAAIDDEVSAELLDEMLDVFDELGLIESREPESREPESIRARQRDARRRHFASLRDEALRAMLERLLELPHYAELLPRPLPEELAALPILDKPTLRARFDQLLPEQLPDDVHWLSTSGTSGERQQVARSPADWAASQAATWALNPTIARSLEGRFCRLTTPYCNGMECHVAHASMAERTRGRRLALASSLDIASWPDARVEQTLHEIREYAPEYLLVDPTYLAIVVDRARGLGLGFPKLRFVLTSFELSSELHRRAIADAFECPVFDAYGATEHGAIVVQCERGVYHVNPESVILEVDSPDSRGAGQLLVTTPSKTLMPLLRYATGDLAIAGDSICACPWSETDSLRSLEGRAVDCLVDTQERRVTPGAIDRAIAAELPGVVTYRLVQRGGLSYRLELLPGQGFAVDRCNRALAALHELLGPGVDLRISVERELLPSASGKFRLACRSER
ncbi:phenylacetate--CoA ligase family protein [Nannocystaceae bacterium ST9]